MKITRIRHLAGPNIYHNRPVSILTLDLERLAEVSSQDIPGFTERLLGLLPGLAEHHCSPGHAGGFVERLRRGTYFGHIVEHIALELSAPVGIGATYGKTIYGGSPGIYQVIVRAKLESGMAEVLKIAVTLAEALANNVAFDLAAALKPVSRLVAREKLGPSTRSIVDAAQARGIPVTRLNNRSLVQLGYGKYRKTIEAAVTSQTSAIALSTVKDKDLTKLLLDAAFILVPRGKVVSSLEEAMAAMGSLGTPVVVKPVDGNHGRGVSLNVATGEQMLSAFTSAQSCSYYVLVEEQYHGHDYRVLVVGGKVTAAALRTPAHVVGDGERSVLELVERENTNPDRGYGHEKPMTQIETGDDAVAFLARRNLSLSHIAAAGEVVFLSETANLSRGGTSSDVTDQIHPQIQLICERAARVVGLDICGVDLIADDISQPLRPRANGIIELNAGPGLRMHSHPGHGDKREVGQAIVEMLFPPGAPSRIPVISITGTNGKTTVTRLISHVFQQLGLRVGMTTTGGISVDGQQIATGDTTGPASARVVLGDTDVDVAVLETARGGIVRRGLGYDFSDVGVVTNIAADHIGQDGINSIEDIIRIKTLVPDRVREGGTVVVNADCPNVLRMMQNPRLARTARKIVFFSLDAQNPTVLRHVAEGGVAYVSRDLQLIEMEKGVETLLVDLHQVPLASGGAAPFQVSNLLATAAACRSQNVPIETLQKAFLGFDPVEHNPGRANAYQVGAGFAVVDYGHNPAAFGAIQTLASRWNGRKISAVLSLPGDRTDELLAHSSRILADTFDQIYLRQDRDLRGREPGRTTAVIRAALRNSKPDIECHEIADELDAVRAGVERLESGEILFVFYDTDPGRVSRLLIELGAQPLPSLPLDGVSEVHSGFLVPPPMRVGGLRL